MSKVTSFSKDEVERLFRELNLDKSVSDTEWNHLHPFPKVVPTRVSQLTHPRLSNNSVPPPTGKNNADME